MEVKPMELTIMELVVNGGNARSKAIEALRLAKDGAFEAAERAMEECESSLSIAHQIQTELIQQEASGDHLEVPLLMVHAQDHLMNAMTVRDLAIEIIDLTKQMIRR